MAYSFGPGGTTQQTRISNPQINPGDPNTAQDPYSTPPPKQNQNRDPQAPPNLTDEEYQAWLEAKGYDIYGPAPAFGQQSQLTPQQPQQVQVQAPQAPPPPTYTLDRNDFMLPGGQALLDQLGNREQSILGRSITDSVSRMQLQQAADENMRRQMAMAAAARPGQAQLAGLTAAQNMGSIGTALAGQQAIAGIQERRDLQAAQDAAYMDALKQHLAVAQQMQQGGQSFAQQSLLQALSQQQMAEDWKKAQLAASTNLQVAGMTGNPYVNALLNTGGQLGGYYATKGGNQNPSGGGSGQSAQDAATQAMSGAGGEPDSEYVYY